MSAPPPTVAQAIARAVAEHGADRAFVFPGGGSNLEVIEALQVAGVDVVLCHSEGGAALMAAAYAHLVCRPVLLLVGLGPGVASAVNGLAHALLDQSALVVISDRQNEAELRRSGHQALDQQALLAPVTKWQAMLAAEGAAETVGRALADAATPPCGPVHLELTREVALATTRPDASRFPAAQPAGMPAARNQAALARAASILTEALRPVVLVGDEALAMRQAQLVALLERVGGPVLCSYKAKGAFPEEHPLWCGIVTAAALEAPLLGAADAILAVGLDPVELLSTPWPASAPIVALREHGERVSGYAPRELLCGEVAELAAALHARLQPPPSAAWSKAAIAAIRTEMLDAIRVAAPGSLSALEVIEAVQAAAPSDAVVTVDAGAHMLAATWGWRSHRPRRFLISNGLATMGFAVPAALAAALADPAAPVIAFTGDGGFLLHAAELETAVRLGARILVVVLNDAGLSLIRIKQEDRRYRRTAVDFGPIDAAGLGRALGTAGVVARSAGEVSAAVGEALGAPGPTVLDVKLTGAEYGELQRVIRSTGVPAPRALVGTPA